MNTLSFFNPRFTSDLFDVIDRNFASFSDEAVGTTMPRVDVAEKKEAYVLEMELPGFTENDLTIDMKDRVLTIASQKKAKPVEDGKKAEDTSFLLRERHVMSFTRSFTMPEDIDADNISAAISNGLLTITIPRRAAAQARRIALQAS